MAPPKKVGTRTFPPQYPHFTWTVPAGIASRYGAPQYGQVNVSFSTGCSPFDNSELLSLRGKLCAGSSFDPLTLAKACPVLS